MIGLIVAIIFIILFYYLGYLHGNTVVMEEWLKEIEEEEMERRNERQKK